MKTSAITPTENKTKQSAKHPLYMHWWPAVIGRVAMWGEVVEHERGWRSEYAGVRSLFKITGDLNDWSKRRLLLSLGEKYGCEVMTEP